MSKPGDVCTPCFASHKTKPAVHWCLSCEESLCSKCGSHHKIQTSTKSHQLNSLSDILMLPSVAMTIRLTCKQHDTKLDVFCSDHSEPCCWKCLAEDHPKCQQKGPLDKVIKNAKTSESFNTLVKSTQDIIEITDNLRKKKKENYKMIAMQKNEMETQIKVFKKDVIKYMESFEKTLLENVTQTFSVCQVEMQGTHDKLNAFYKQCVDIDKNLTNMKQFASDLQTFLGARSLRSRVATIETGILGLRKQLGDYKLEFESPFNIHYFQSIMASLEDIKIVHWKRDDIVNCEMDGTICWIFERQDLKCPNGLTVDHDGSVLVVGTSSGNILKISFDGSSAKEILRTENFFKSPTDSVEKITKRILSVTISQMVNAVAAVVAPQPPPPPDPLNPNF
ncbi:protein PML-like [Mytilus trossulus]|uniref:protein PML-like n=1 Tax=Mytilus trossulus TaxID=6551 RepID=UPI0030049DBE